jgi:hypothetical protein
MAMSPRDEVKNTVIRVGDGRGFIIEADGQRLVITAAHCLPHFPPCHGANYLEERTYAKLLGRRDDPLPTVWAECLFVDPIADVAVLGSPDRQDLLEQADDYEALVTVAPALSIDEMADPDRLTEQRGEEAWLLSLDGRWTTCSVRVFRGLWIDHAVDGIRGGMSGSPILNSNGKAIGVVCIGSGTGTEDTEACAEGGPNPRLTLCLPGWLLREITEH